MFNFILTSDHLEEHINSIHIINKLYNVILLEYQITKVTLPYLIVRRMSVVPNKKKNDYLMILSKLLERGESPKAPIVELPDKTDHPILLAIKTSQLDVVKLLIKYGASEFDNFFNYSLSLSLIPYTPYKIYENYDFCECSLMVNFDGMVDLEMINYLLSIGMDKLINDDFLDCRNVLGGLCRTKCDNLPSESYKNRLDLIKLLLFYGADINTPMFYNQKMNFLDYIKIYSLNDMLYILDNIPGSATKSAKK